jgi:hypothetical protein
MLPEPGALHLTRRQDLLDLELPEPNLGLYSDGEQPAAAPSDAPQANPSGEPHEPQHDPEHKSQPHTG